MLSIMRYYWQDARKYRQLNKQMLWDTGMKRSMLDMLEDALERVRRWMWERRYVRWK